MAGQAQMLVSAERLIAMAVKNNFSTFLEKKVKLFFDDGNEVRFKIGIVKEVNEFYITLETQEGLQQVAMARFVRAEVLEGEDK